MKNLAIAAYLLLSNIINVSFHIKALNVQFYALLAFGVIHHVSLLTCVSYTGILSNSNKVGIGYQPENISCNSAQTYCMVRKLFQQKFYK